MLNRIMRHARIRGRRWVVVVVVVACCSHWSSLTSAHALSAVVAQGDESQRETPLVRAVAKARPSVVNLRGRKTVRPEASQTTPTQTVRQVNGMGTGVIIDARGYVLTNYHVVEDVSRIQVTLADGTTTTAELMAVDSKTDLALLKIPADKPLPVIPLGTSCDLMLAETVAAVGNAYGYEHTVTRGIISEIGRTVQVSDTQIYHNLIQTDAPINPGNSGGPLLNLDGEMIGINVAVRVGAHGIAFAIPVNDAIEIGARLLGQTIERRCYHGLSVTTGYVGVRPRLEVSGVESGSPAEQAGLRSGQIIAAIDGQPAERALDLQRALLDKRPGETLDLQLQDGSRRTMTVAASAPSVGVRDVAWRDLGMMLRPITAEQMHNAHPNYQRGLKVESVRSGSLAEREGIRAGDILVAMHGWKTESLDNVAYVLQQPDIRQGTSFKFYVLRGNEALWGQLRVARSSD